MTTPADPDIAARRYHALQRRGRATGRPTDELLHLYALEGLLARLAISPHRDRLVLKGGMLLAAFDTRRPTRDVDLQAQQLHNDVDAVRETIVAIAAIEVADGLAYDTDSATAQSIRDENAYSGVRVILDASLATGRMKLKVDVSVGDPIWPEPADVAVDRLLDDAPIHLLGYPLPMVYAEKLVTALSRGTVNTRWRDFADLYLLTRRHDQDAGQLRAALEAVAAHRQVALQPLTDTLAGYAELAQGRWAAWRRKQQLDDRLPAHFGDVLAYVLAFADPVLDDPVLDATWRAETLHWQ